MHAEATQTVVLYGQEVKVTPNDLERFWSKVEKTSHVNGCWIWNGCRNKEGYGRFHFKMKRQGAHRISFLFKNGHIPSQMLVCHSCDNPSCVNPNHLWLGTDQQNMNDRGLKGRNKVGIGERQHLAKLNAALVMEIRDKFIPKKMGAKKLSQFYNVSHHAIWCILKRKTWKHI